MKGAQRSIQLSKEKLQAHSTELLEDGVTQIGTSELQFSNVSELAAGVEAIVVACLPASFILLYDEAYVRKISLVH
mgnify:FL=1